MNFKWPNIVFFSLILALKNTSATNILQVQKILVCEGSSFSIDCDTKNIRLISALYGRWNSTTCRNYSITTPCFHDQTSTYQNNCNNKKTCTVTPSNSVSGDPCPNKSKYLLATYACVESSPSSCPLEPSQFVQVDGVWYFQNDDTKSFQDASSMCQNLGGNLAIISDQKTHDATWFLTGDKERWIGVVNPDTISCNSIASCTGKKLWIDGSNMVSGLTFQFSWNIGSGGGCARVQNDMTIDSTSCSSSKASLCQNTCPGPCSLSNMTLAFVAGYNSTGGVNFQ